VNLRKGKKMAGANDNIKIIAQNRKAYHEYFVEDKIECGIVLAGTEVKSLRKGAVNFRDSYAEISNGECFLCGMHISPYEQGNIFNKDPLRDRKLLLHKSEINRLLGYVKQKGLTLVPLELYFSKGKVKLLLGVARGKKLYDKRDSIAAKDTAREIDRRMKESFRE
jgi:SsrA-binding protein